jgi:phosphate/sulfate permease
VVAALVAGSGTWLLYRISRSLSEGARGQGFRIGQIGSASMVSLAHGTNDAQKTMGVITLAPALFAVGLRALAGSGGGAQAAEGAPAIGRAGPAGLALAGLCFLIVLAAIGWGIWAIYEAGH